jgi:hypothetical protein
LIKENYLKSCGLIINNDNIDEHFAVFGENFKIMKDHTFIKRVDQYMELFFNNNAKKDIFDPITIINKWKSVYYGSVIYEYNMKIYKIAKKSRVNSLTKIDVTNKIKFLLKCLINHRIKIKH